MRQEKRAKEICTKEGKAIFLKSLKLIFMDQDQNPSLFGLNIDGSSKNFLAEAARWGRFLAIMGFIICGLIIIAGIYMATNTTEMSRAFSRFGGESTGNGLGAAMAIVYIIVAAIYFFPCLFLLRFSIYMKAALATDDQNTLTASFQNLKSMFKFVGIFTIIILSFYTLAFIFGGLGGAFR